MILGHISDSTKITFVGLQYFKNFLMKNFISSGRYWCTTLLENLFFRKIEVSSNKKTILLSKEYKKIFKAEKLSIDISDFQKKQITLLRQKYTSEGDVLNRGELGIQGSRPAEIIKLWLGLRFLGMNGIELY